MVEGTRTHHALLMSFSGAFGYTLRLSGFGYGGAPWRSSSQSLGFWNQLKETITHSILFNQPAPTCNMGLEVDDFVRAIVTLGRDHHDNCLSKKARGDARKMNHGRG
ncbi:hypothetical protein GOP47_0017798 [Adiantum capillus-veneris]|uniref:Uncharacterized protein n=1 Tax=Adiantum capillus-veneris TaxID=13818 RepID=A0A9D4ZB61_ADICA|nr:hypothetical protein GOP47_0017798 [Adiantum capillus-veneris]